MYHKDAHVHIYIFAHIHMYTSIHIWCTHPYVYIYMYIYIYIYAHVHMHTSRCVRTHIYMCTYSVLQRSIHPTETPKLRCYNWMKRVGMAKVLPACPFGCMAVATHPKQKGCCLFLDWNLEVCMRLSPNAVPPIPIRKSGVPSFPTKICMIKGPSRVPTQKNL